MFTILFFILRNIFPTLISKYQLYKQIKQASVTKDKQWLAIYLNLILHDSKV